MRAAGMWIGPWTLCLRQPLRVCSDQGPCHPAAVQVTSICVPPVFRPAGRDRRGSSAAAPSLPAADEALARGIAGCALARLQIALERCAPSGEWLVLGGTGSYGGGFQH
jgi:hypothetical protein